MNAVAPSLAEDVAVLYVDPGGPYPGLVRHWYDEARDAKTYAGPWPVVAHPPCGPWGRLKFLCTKQDASAGPHGVAMVQRWGGVLEHPEHSTLFRHCKLPRPGELADEHGGRTYAVRQVAWGHPCEKRTWLYVVGVAPAVVLAGLRTDGRPTHRVTNGSRGDTSLPRANDATNRRSAGVCRVAHRARAGFAAQETRFRQRIERKRRMKTIEVTFAFEIGDEVQCGIGRRLAEHSAEFYRRTHKDSYVNKPSISVPVFQVLERIAQECPGGVQRFYMCRGYVADKYGDGASHFPDSMRFHEHELIAYVPVALPNGDPSGGAK